MKLSIQFGHTSSPRLAEAIRKARKFRLTQLDAEKGSEFSVSMEVPFANPERWKQIEELLRIVGLWKSTIFSLDGKKIQPHWQATWELSQIISCYSTKQTTRRDGDYCLGKDTPSSDMTSFACRFLKGVDIQGHGGNNVRWYDFGDLSDDRKKFAVDKKAIDACLHNTNQSAPCVSCPAFSWRRVSDAVDSLPLSHSIVFDE